MVLFLAISAGQLLNADADVNIFTYFFSWTGQILQGDIGNSTLFAMPIAQILPSHLWLSLELLLIAFIIASLLAGLLLSLLPLSYSRLQQYPDSQTSLILYFITSITLLLLVTLATLFMIDAPLFADNILFATPVFENNSASHQTIFHYLWLGDYHTLRTQIWQRILPLLAFILPLSWYLWRYIGYYLQQYLRNDYIMLAKTRHIAKHKFIIRYMLLPIGTLLGYFLIRKMTLLLSAGIIIETIFNYQGLGQLLVSALLNRDVALAQISISFYAIFLTLLYMLTIRLKYQEASQS